MKRRIGVIITVLAVLGGLAGISSTAAVAQTTKNAIHPSAVAAGTSGVLANGSGLCLGIQGSSTGGGAKAEVGTCSGTATQTWHVRATASVGGAIGYQLENGVGMCLGVSGGSTASGAQVVQGACSPTTDHSQIWRPAICVETSSGATACGGFTSDPAQAYYWLVNGHSGMCLGVQGSSENSGSLVLQGTCSWDSVTQNWFI